jgi:hypothetical protein
MTKIMDGDKDKNGMWDNKNETTLTVTSDGIMG